ncbi:MAG TPA: papain-like cysteine protease family protein [Bryobacteraceae bacterium]|nr:papain-like cysteine protease family protein [Bryobacteraceae bacterium]
MSALMDIWQSGGYNDGSGGSAPAAYAFPAAPGQAFTFPSVTGTWTCNFGVPEYGPDGTTVPTCYTQASNFSATGPFSGLDLVDFQGPLVGMFLEDTLPASPPPTLRFYISDSSQGGIRTNLATLSPQIGQVFFIGDGRTGTGTGAIQVFDVPPTATHLYLGYADSCDYATPGCYGDNEGSMTATFAISACSFQVSNVTPQIQLAGRAWATQAGMMLSWKSGKLISGAAAAAIADSIAPTTTVFATDYANGGASGCAELDNCSISLSDYTNFLTRLGIIQVDSSPTVCGLAENLRKYGPATIVTGTPTPNFVHAVVLTGVTGDGTGSGSAVNLIDPDTGAASSVSLASLLLGIEAAQAAGWPEFVQFP